MVFSKLTNSEKYCMLFGSQLDHGKLKISVFLCPLPPRLLLWAVLGTCLKVASLRKPQNSSPNCCYWYKGSWISCGTSHIRLVLFHLILSHFNNQAVEKELKTLKCIKWHDMLLLHCILLDLFSWGKHWIYGKKKKKEENQLGFGCSVRLRVDSKKCNRNKHFING